VIHGLLSNPCFAPALFMKTSQPSSGAPATFAHLKSRVPVCPLRFYVRAGPSALLGLMTSQAWLSPLNQVRSFSLLTCPLVLCSVRPCDRREPEPPGLFSQRLGVSLRKGCRPVWPFSPTASATPLKDEYSAGYFFTSKTKDFLRSPSCILCAAYSLPPNGS
jgi:hypothetical protein